jgi:hypothetical protein
MAEIPQTRYARSGDADIAYQVFGSGEDMVAIQGLTSHLEVMWELPEFAAGRDQLDRDSLASLAGQHHREG